MNLRATAAWAGAIALTRISDAGLIYRLRRSATWLEELVAKALEGACPVPAQGRLIRIVDGTSVAKAGRRPRKATESGASTALSICPWNASAISC
jgi:hypothetical protein